MTLLSKLPGPLGNGFMILSLVFGAAFLATFFTANPKRITGKRASEAPKPLTELPHFETKSEYHRSGRRDSIAGESVNEEDLKTSKKVFHEKSPEARARIAEMTSKILFFRNLDRRQKEDIIDAIAERKVPSGEVIIKQGDEGDFFYIVESGKFEILVNGSKVADSKEGQFFGELALLYSQPRAATVKALSASSVWAVDRSTFRRIVLGSNARKRQQYQRFLKEVPILSSLTGEEVIKASDALEPASFQAGESIITEGDFGDVFYIIEEGTVSIRVKGTEVAKKSKGEYFGEIALLTDGYRVASVVAEGNVECLAMDKNAFTRLLGPCVDILKRNMEQYKKYEGEVEGN